MTTIWKNKEKIWQAKDEGKKPKKRKIKERFGYQATEVEKFETEELGLTPFKASEG